MNKAFSVLGASGAGILILCLLTLFLVLLAWRYRGSLAAPILANRAGLDRPAAGNLFISLVVLSFVVLTLITHALFHVLPFDTVVLVVLSLIAGYFVIHGIILYWERKEIFEPMTEALADLAASVGVLRILRDPDEYYRELEWALERATKSAKLLYLTKYPPREIGQQAQRYWEWFNAFAKGNGARITIKRIASLDTEGKFKWLKQNTVELGEVTGYGIRCYKPDANFRLVGLEVIDEKEVFLFGPHGQTPRWLHVKNADVAAGWSTYFEELWGHAGDPKYGFELKAVGDNLQHSKLDAFDVFYEGQPSTASAGSQASERPAPPPADANPGIGGKGK